MFRIYAEDRKLVSTADDHTNGKEIHYKTYKEAEKELNSIKDFFPKDYLKIVPIKCESCKGHEDLSIYQVSNESKALCSNCFWEMQNRVPLMKTGKLLSVSKETLESSGYDIEALNLDDLLEDEKKMTGRPPIGITRKVSLTLSEEEWNWFDEQANGNRSQYLRKLISEAQSKKK